ncbi:MAG: hypothetical protein AB7U23_11205 [Dehalococcoidia bacterium]
MNSFGQPPAVDKAIAHAFREAASLYSSLQLATGQEGHPWGRIQLVALAGAVALAASAPGSQRPELGVICIRACELWLPEQLWADSDGVLEAVNGQLVPLAARAWNSERSSDHGTLLDVLSIPFGSLGIDGEDHARALHASITGTRSMVRKPSGAVSTPQARAAARSADEAVAAQGTRLGTISIVWFLLGGLVHIWSAVIVGNAHGAVLGLIAFVLPVVSTVYAVVIRVVSPEGWASLFASLFGLALLAFVVATVMLIRAGRQAGADGGSA